MSASWLRRFPAREAIGVLAVGLAAALGVAERAIA